MKFSESFENLKSAISSDQDLDFLNKSTYELSQDIKKATYDKKLTTIFGNGGSAADAQHWAAEMTCTYKSKKRDPFLALALTTDTSIITAWSNDINFDDVFRRQIFALSSLNGLSIGLSTSGKSPNVLNALKEAKKHNAKTVLISGLSRIDKTFIDFHIEFNSTDTPTIQLLTQMLYHSVCEYLETL
tara:strand:- start:11041 stop:11601 length:561 start_codon:yes stop_codon:yes gene_type:complete